MRCENNNFQWAPMWCKVIFFNDEKGILKLVFFDSHAPRAPHHEVNIRLIVKVKVEEEKLKENQNHLVIFFFFFCWGNTKIFLAIWFLPYKTLCLVKALLILFFLTVNFVEVDKRVHVTSKSNKRVGRFAQVMDGGPFFYNERRKYFQCYC